jgi:serine/threonine protein kinase
MIAKDDREPVGTDKVYQPLSQAKLGSGGFGTVDIWYHHSKYSLCAAKFFKHAESFSKELEVVKGLKHENVLRLITFYDEERILIFDMFACSLEELLSRDVENGLGLSESMMYTLIKNMSDALRYLLYEKHIVHRDIKPQNILFDEHRKAFILADFGLALSFDTQSFEYTSVPGGTKEYVHPSLLQNNEINISVNKELWPLAVTYFKAATGRHPYFTRTRDRWIQLMLNKPDDKFWIDEQETYRSDFNFFTQLSVGFKTTILIPLLLEMMSSNANFTHYFLKIEELHMSKDQIVHVFDIEQFHLIHLTKDQTNFYSTVEQILGYDQNLLKACQDGKLLNQNSKLQESSEIQPVILFGNNLKLNVSELKKKIGRHLFTDVNWTEIPTGKDKSVFKATVRKIELISRYVNLVREFSSTIYQRAIQDDIRLNTKWEDFSRELEEIAKIKTPGDELNKLITEIERDIRRESCVDLKTAEASADLLSLPEVVSFFKCVSVMDQNKLKAIKRHLRHVQIALEIAVEAVTKYVCEFIELWSSWIKETNDYEIQTKHLIAKSEFVSHELNKLLVNKIMSLS